MSVEQFDIFDYAKRLRDDGMALAASHCEGATEAAYRLLCRLARTRHLLHIDDFLPLLDTLPEKPAPNAMGTIWRRAKKDGLIEESGAFRPCASHARKHAHNYPIYRSLVCGGVE